MIPTQPYYPLFVGTGLLLALAFPVSRHIGDERLRRQYYFLQVLTLVGAVIGAKLAVLFGDQHWPWVPVASWWNVLGSGRSIMGALLFGFLFAEVAKPFIKYPLPPNDRFAALLPFSIGIGRIGCLLAGCCGGIPNAGWCALRGPDGVPRYPTQIFEIIFQIATGIVFIMLVKRGLLFGRLYSVYLMAYGVFRFLTEFVRDTPKFFGPFSGYQILALLMMATGGVYFLMRTLAFPPGWDAYRVATRMGRAQPET